MSVCGQLLSYLRTRSIVLQLNVIIIPVLAILIMICSIINIFNGKYVTSIFAEASTTLVNHQNINQITLRLEKLVNISQQLLNMNANRVQTMNFLYQKSFENTGSNQSTEALLVSNTVPSYYQYPLMQYAPMVGPIGTDVMNQQFINFTSIVNTILLALDTTQMFTVQDSFMVLNTSAQLYAQWPIPPPSQQPIATFTPLDRPWYKDHVKYRKETGRDLWMTPIYSFIYPFQLGMSITNSLLYNGEFKGVVCSDVSFAQLQSFLDLTPDQLIFIYENGTIIFQNAYTNITLKDELIYVYNQSITGFNSTQWELFQSKAGESPYNNIMQEHNSVFNITMTINIHKFEGLPFYLILFSNLEGFELQKSLSQEIVDDLKSFERINLLNVSLIQIFLLTMISILLIQVLSAINRIITYKDRFNQITQKNTLFLKKKGNNQLVNLEYQLIKVILRLNKLSMKKSKECRLLEDYQFPKSIRTSVPIEYFDDEELNEAQIRFIHNFNLRKYLQR